MRTLRIIGFAAFMVAAFGIPAAAQDRSAIDELIDGARSALDNLEYDRAGSIARSLLVMGDRASADQRVAGLQLMAAAMFPEERAAQQRDSARVYLEELVRATPDAVIPAGMSWPGLDELLTSVRATTFAVWARPDSQYELQGAEADARIEVAAARPAVFQLIATAIGDGSSIVLDSAGPAATATLRVRALADDHPVLPWGEYWLDISGTDSVSGQTLALRYHATVKAPPLLLHRVPASPDSSLFRPERAPRRPLASAALGVAIGAATVLTATVVSGSEEVGSHAGSSGPYVVGAGITLGALIGVVLDRGRPLPANIAYNATVRDAFAKRVGDLRAENARRRAEYRATITLQRGAP